MMAPMKDNPAAKRARFACSKAHDVDSPQELRYREKQVGDALQALTDRDLQVELRNGFLYIWESV